MRKHEPIMSVARPAWKFFLPLALLSAAGFWLWYPAGIVLALLAFYVLYFFRDPRRQVPRIPGAFVSPADGKVVSVMEVPCERMPGGRARRIAIFLNVFNVHIQRASHQGRVVAIDRKPGKFLNALNEKCSEENEQVTVWLEDDEGVFGIRQIAGAIARRIVCDVKEGDWLDRGQRYGLIQFGSRVELFLPLEASVKVTPGQKVRGGESCLALVFEEEARKGRFPSKDVAVPRDLAEVG
jgi:phosphatidylserine decarboxylase